MNHPFTIGLSLYLDRESLDSGLKRGEGPVLYEEFRDLAVFQITTPAPHTIETQFTTVGPELNKILSKVRSSGYQGKIIFCVVIRAYVYSPEIIFPQELVTWLGAAHASIEVDLINMIEAQPD